MERSPNDGEEHPSSNPNTKGRMWDEIFEILERTSKESGSRLRSRKASLPEQFPAQSKDRSERLPRSKSMAGTIFSSLLYLWGAICCVSALTEILLGTASLPAEIVTLMWVGAGLLSLLLLTVVLVLHKHPHLRWWTRLLAVLAATAIGFISMMISMSLIRPGYIHGVISSQTELALGSIVLIYGLIVAFVALR